MIVWQRIISKTNTEWQEKWGKKQNKTKEQKTKKGVAASQSAAGGSLGQPTEGSREDFPVRVTGEEEMVERKGHFCL